MNTDTMLEVLRLLAPTGSTAIVAGVLAYQSPKLVKELFAGVGGLLLTIQKIKRERNTSGPRRSK